MFSFFAGILLVFLGSLYNWALILRDRPKKISHDNNIISGCVEYYIAWNIFHEEIIYEVYYDAMKNGKTGFGIYDSTFTKSTLYGGLSPAAEAVRRAIEIMIKNGRVPYIPYWGWDDARNVLDNVAQRCMANPFEHLRYWEYCRYSFHDITSRFLEEEDLGKYRKAVLSDPLVKLPAKNDLWRDYYKRAGSTEWVLKKWSFNDLYEAKGYEEGTYKRDTLPSNDVFPPPLPESDVVGEMNTKLEPEVVPVPEKKVIINERYTEVETDPEDYIYDWYSLD